MPSSRNQAGSLKRERAAVQFLKRFCPAQPALAVILGSGFHGVVDKLVESEGVDYKDIPGFRKPSVQGHQGRLYAGMLAGAGVLLLSGRSHYYEGCSMEEVAFPVRVLAGLGVPNLLLTNSAGGINAKFRPGELMVIRDHINFMGVNPLRGTDGMAFVDLSQVYDSALIKLLRSAARKASIKIREGVYLAVSGPSYETPAEIRAFRKLGADAVGMSTVPEAIVARQCQVRVAGISCISNGAAGSSPQPITHREVLETARKAEHGAALLIEHFARLLGNRL